MSQSTGETHARETVVARLRPHARALIGPTALLLVVAAAFGYLGGSFPELWQNLALAGVCASPCESTGETPIASAAALAYEAGG